MESNIYALTAQFYDTTTEREEVQVDLQFYLDLIRPGETVLDVGCGTGRIAIPLAGAGCHVVGIDLSRPMLDRFEPKLAERPDLKARITLFESSMTDFDLGRRFDWIIFPFRTFQSQASRSDQLSCLAATLRHLGDDGRVVLTLFNPRRDALDSWGKQKTRQLEWPIPESDRTLHRYENQLKHDPAAQTIETEQVYQVFEGDRLIEEAVDHLILGYLYPQQAQALIEEAGFEVEQAYATYDKEPLRPDVQKEQIYIIKRAA